MTAHIQPVPLAKAYRLLNHGPTVLVSARHGDATNVMAAAWACALDFDPPKLTVVLDRNTRTRELVDQSGRFGIQVPTATQATLVKRLGSISQHDDPDKLATAGARLVELPGTDLPFVDGCSAWLACRVIPEPHNQSKYDLFIAEVVAAWADDRVFSNGHWTFETAPPELRSLHYVAGGQFYAIGESIHVGDGPAG
jgi:flavin reductase (DIM6/NTAB) family NADH-FMN oxidoreductase RutF